MPSRLLTSPPLDPEGLLDYAQLTIAEAHEDLCETLSDLVLNANQGELEPYLDRLEADEVWDHARADSQSLPGSVVEQMQDLRRAQDMDQCLRKADSRKLLADLVGVFEKLPADRT